MTTTAIELAAPTPMTSTLASVDDALKLVRHVGESTFVPREYRGKPGELLAAILTGQEIGLPPMASMSKVHNIQGRAGLSAEAMRAVVLARGHELWIVEASNERVTVAGRRAGSEHASQFTWTMDDARKANLASKQVWRQFPKAMLLARATGELCRAIFADVLSGISYTIEELQDGGIDDEAPLDVEPDADAPAPKPAASRTRSAPAKGAAKTAKRTTTTTAPPAPAADPVAEVDDIDGVAADDDIAEGDVVIDEKDLKHVHAVSSKLWPGKGDDVDELRKGKVLDLVEVLGGGRVESRSDVPESVVPQLLYVLDTCADPESPWTAGTVDELIAGARELKRTAGGLVIGPMVEGAAPAAAVKLTAAQERGLVVAFSSGHATAVAHIDDVNDRGLLWDLAQRVGADVELLEVEPGVWEIHIDGEEHYSGVDPDTEDDEDDGYVEGDGDAGPSDAEGWKELARSNGVPLSRMYRRAQELAGELGVEGGPGSAPAILRAPVELRVRLAAWLAGGGR